MSWMELGARFSNILLKLVGQARICLRQDRILAKNMFVICLYCVKVIFQGLCKKNQLIFIIFFGKLETAIFKDFFQCLFPKTIMLVIPQKHIQIFPLHALLVPKTKISGRKKRRELVSRLASMLSICLFLPLIPG